MSFPGSFWNSSIFWTALGSLASLVTAVIAVLAARYALGQVRGLRDQLAVSVRQGVSQLYGQVSSFMFQLNDTLDKNPGWIEYFFYDAAPPRADGTPKDRTLRLRLENMCERYMDLVDGVVEQHHAMPRSIEQRSMDWSTWEFYFRYLYRHSPVLREYVRDNLDFYPDYIFAALGHIVVRTPASGQVTARWVVREVTEPGAEDSDDRRLACRLFGDGALNGVLSGYPWIRPWLIHPDSEGWEKAPPSQAPAVLATVTAVTAERGGGMRAEMRLRLRGPVTEGDDLEAIRQWLSATLANSDDLTRAEFHTGDGAEQWVSAYDLGEAVPAAEPSFMPWRHERAATPRALPRSDP